MSDNPKPVSENLIEVLRTTLQEVEESAELSQDHPVMIKLKRSLTRVLSDLEAAENGQRISRNLRNLPAGGGSN